MTLTTEEFAAKAEAIRPGEFDYSKSVYKTSDTDIKINCLKCKGFVITKPRYLTNKNRKTFCKVCSSSTRQKVYKDYVELAAKYGFEYLAEEGPANVRVMEKAWKCENNHIIRSCYNYIHQGVSCSECAENRPKNLKDYQEICGELGKYILKTVPANAQTRIEGWICFACEELFTSTFSNIQSGSWCGCTSNKPKTLEDYQNVCDPKLGEYILDTIPPNAKTPVNGWFCFACDDNYTACFGTVLDGKWCGCTRFKTEAKLKEILLEYFPELKCQFSPKWMKNPDTGHQLRYDFYIIVEGIKIIIELDGDFHFRIVRGSNPAGGRRRDVIKMAYALSRGIYIIRLYQPDVWKDKDNWKKKLLYHIDKITKSDYKGYPQVKLLTDKEKYELHLNELDQYLEENEEELDEMFGKLTINK